ncbi:signal recognition particle [Candidatus Bathyarchaeota archaeon RBG_16_48_13]|nr:MAG: signal recognition particle [Candidatus Bathyarchaeota archaeon RBG_16_48_13]
MRKILRTTIVDEAQVKELVKDLQRALLQADVKVELVLQISRRIEEKALKEDLPPGVARREHVVKVVYDELTNFLGEKTTKLDVTQGRTNIFMMVGVQGSGKTTTTAKLARYYQKRGFKTGLICADTFRPGAYQQLKQLASQVNIPLFGDSTEKDSVKVVKQGLEKFRQEGLDIVFIDTMGRHKDEKSLIEDMKMTSQAVKPDEIILVIDGTIGQQAEAQAKAFHEATPIGSIIVSKLDGSARGGGALSAVAVTGAPIKFIGTGERLENLEAFVPSQFVGRLLGMGDIEGLVEKVKTAKLETSEKKVKAIISGRLTLEDMYEQLEAMQKVGPFKQILKMVPGLGYKVPDEAVDVAEERLKKWRFIIQSMTREEKEEPKILNSPRVKRVSRGSGTSEKDVKDMIQQYFAMKKMMKSLKRRKMPFFKGFQQTK